MSNLTRRSLLRTSVGLAAAGAFARPYIANAQAKTALVWWVQGLVEEEDTAFKKLVGDYEKLSGNKIDYSIVPFAPLRQKIVSAITSGVVPDLTTIGLLELPALQAWQGNLVDVSDVLEPHKEKIVPAALATAYCYNNVEKRRSYYCVPYGATVNPFHIWGSLVEKAGFKVSDIPKTWDAFIDFFIPVEKKLQSMGMRHTYATAFVVSTIGNDPNATLAQFLLAYGANNIVTPDGQLHVDDKQVQEGVIKSLEKLTTLYKEKHIPPSSINWNDTDDNNAFHSKLCVMDFDGTLSTELGMLRNQKDEYNDVVTMPPQLDNNGKQMMTQMGIAATMIPKGAKNVEVAKDLGPPAMAERRARALPADLSGNRQERPVVDRPKARLARAALCPARPDQPDQAGLLRLQPGLGAGAQRAHIPRRLPRHRGRQGAGEGRGGEGDEAGRGDFHQIPDHLTRRLRSPFSAPRCRSIRRPCAMRKADQPFGGAAGPM